MWLTACQAMRRLQTAERGRIGEHHLTRWEVRPDLLVPVRQDHRPGGEGKVGPQGDTGISEATPRVATASPTAVAGRSRLRAEGRDAGRAANQVRLLSMAIATTTARHRVVTSVNLISTMLPIQGSCRIGRPGDPVPVPGPSDRAVATTPRAANRRTRRSRRRG